MYRLEYGLEFVLQTTHLPDRWINGPECNQAMPNDFPWSEIAADSESDGKESKNCAWMDKVKYLAKPPIIYHATSFDIAMWMVKYNGKHLIAQEPVIQLDIFES